VKPVLEARLWAETTMTVGWIAESLEMGMRGYLSHLLCRRRQLDGDCTKSRTDPFSDPFSREFQEIRHQNRYRKPTSPQNTPKTLVAI